MDIIFLPFSAPSSSWTLQLFYHVLTVCKLTWQKAGFYFLVGKLGLFKVRTCRCALTKACTHTQTHTSALVLPVAMHQALKSHSFKSAPPGWTCPLYQDIAETASIPHTADKPLHLSHRVLQELQVNLLQSWIRATASVAVRPEIQDLF